MPHYTEWDTALEDEIARPFPPEKIKTKKKGGKDIAFVSWYDYVARLNSLVGPSGWSIGEPTLYVLAGRIAVATSVTILGVTKGNVGDEDEEKEDWGTPALNAYAQALKRCCALFGMGLDMYYKEERAGRQTAKSRAASDATGPLELRKGAHAGKLITDATVPTNYLISLLPKSPDGIAAQLNREIERRAKAKGAATNG